MFTKLDAFMINFRGSTLFVEEADPTISKDDKVDVFYWDWR